VHITTYVFAAVLSGFSVSAAGTRFYINALHFVCVCKRL